MRWILAAGLFLVFLTGCASTTWAPVGSQPLSDDTAASLVIHRPETRPGNVAANNYVPTNAELVAFQSPPHVNAIGLRQYVTGRPGLSNPSTDDLIQWVAYKWGIPEDWIRAVMMVESDFGGVHGWNQNSMGDRETVSASDYLLYPPQARIPGTSDVYQSMGISSVKWLPPPSVEMSPGSEPLRWKSTAFNLDLWAANVRWYYNGGCVPCGAGYSAGQTWNSIGAWYSKYPWNNPAAQTYIGWVQDALRARAW